MRQLKADPLSGWRSPPNQTKSGQRCSLATRCLPSPRGCRRGKAAPRLGMVRVSVVSPASAKGGRLTVHPRTGGLRWSSRRLSMRRASGPLPLTKGLLTLPTRAAGRKGWSYARSIGGNPLNSYCPTLARLRLASIASSSTIVPGKRDVWGITCIRPRMSKTSTPSQAALVSVSIGWSARSVRTRGSE